MNGMKGEKERTAKMKRRRGRERKENKVLEREDKERII
jgi:hypothetical protein